MDQINQIPITAENVEKVGKFNLKIDLNRFNKEF